METHHITTGKIVSSPTDTTWAQAYSAGKLYTVLSLKGTSDTTLAALGKDINEKLQREFFALDDKSLATIKKAVETSVSDVPSETTYSLVLTTVVNDALYIVIANSGYIVLKRGDNASVIAAGENNSIATFSGKYETHDIFILTTGSFLKTIPLEEVTKTLEDANPHEIAESLALLIHEKSTGLEAGLIIKMGGHQSPIATPRDETVSTQEQELEEKNDHLELGEEMPQGSKFALPVLGLTGLRNLIPKRFSRKQLIAGAIIVLVIVLGGGILLENSKRQDAQLNTQAQALVDSQKERFDEAVAVIGLNKSLAIEQLSGIKTNLEPELNKFPEGSESRKTIDDFLKQIEEALGGNTSSGSSPISVFLEPKDDIKTIAFVTNKGGTLTISGGTTASTISSTGGVEKTFESENAKGISASETNIFILTSKGVQKIEKSSGDADEIFEAAGKSIDTFGDNIYVLEGKTINKYRPNTYAKEAYLTGDITLTDPSSIAIDSSIYVVDEGKIKKFTRGAEDSFSYNGPSLSNKSLAYTDEEYTNLYVADPASKMAYVIGKSGNKVSEVSLKGMRTITGISASETEKRIYIAGDNKIYSINF